jgi:hypothetical protein
MPPILNLNPFIIKKHTQKTNEINKQQQNKTTSTDSNRVPLVEQAIFSYIIKFYVEPISHVSQI